MEFLLNIFLSIVGIFDVRSSDPILAALKHSRRALIVCMVADIAFIVLAFFFAPEGLTESRQPEQLAEQFRHYIGTGFAFAAIVCMAGMVWFAVKCLHIYFKPEVYVK